MTRVRGPDGFTPSCSKVVVACSLCLGFPHLKDGSKVLKTSVDSGLREAQGRAWLRGQVLWRLLWLLLGGVWGREGCPSLVAAETGWTAF